MSRSSFVLEQVHSDYEYVAERLIDGFNKCQPRELTEMHWRRLSPEAQNAEP